MTYLTVPISANNLDKAARQIKAAKAAGAEMLELRTDYLENLSVPVVNDLITVAKKKSALPIIVTCRDKQQGGAIDYPQQLRVQVLCSALRAGAEFVDFEYDNFLSMTNQEKIRVALSQNTRARLILSVHNFETKFDSIGKLYRRITTAHPAAIPKLVYTANHINDCFAAFDLLHNTSDERIVFCMGASGLVSRVIAKKLGSLVTFASLDEKNATAPGQLTIRQLKNLYRYDYVNTDTELYGIIGSPIAHSLSPAVHNESFANIKANKIYLPLLVDGGKDEFDLFMRGVLARGWLGFRGFSVTIPHKSNAVGYAKGSGGVVEPLAEKIGAANTVLIDADGKLSAYNTDYAGALDALTSALKIKEADLNGMAVAVIGAGGAARAVVAGLRSTGAKVKIYNRTVEKGQKLAAEFGCDFAGLEDLQGLDAKLVINCTSVGMHPNVDVTPLPKKCLQKDMTVFDTVYNPAQTMLLKQAEEKGAKTIDGISMFINQAAAQLKLFTGKNPNPKLMRKTISNCTAKQ